MDSEGERFVEAVSKLPGLWRSIDIRVVAIRIDGEWHNLATNCSLDSRLANDVPRYPHLPVTAHVRAWQVVLDVEALSGLLRQFGEGRFELNNDTVHYVRVQSQDERPPYTSWGYSFLGLSAGHARFPREWACHRLIAMGDTGGTLVGKLSVRLSDLDNSLRALPHPFDGLEGLAAVFLGESGLVESGHSTIFQVVAPIHARFDPAECRLSDGELRFSVVSESQAATELSSVGFVGNRADLPPLSESLRLIGANWSPRGGVLCYEGQCKVPGVHKLSLFLRVSDWPVDRLRLADPASAGRNPRIEAHRVFDPDLDLLRDWMNPTRPTDSSTFEKGVARLLTLHGFCVDLLSGDRRLGDAVDLIGYADPASLVVAVECTTGSIDAGGKLGKLVGRARQVQAALPSYEVVPILVTAMPRHMISEAEMKAAAEDRVIVVAREDLDELLSMLADQTSPSRVVDFLKSRSASMSGLLPGDRGR